MTDATGYRRYLFPVLVICISGLPLIPVMTAILPRSLSLWKLLLLLPVLAVAICSAVLFRPMVFLCLAGFSLLFEGIFHLDVGFTLKASQVLAGLALLSAAFRGTGDGEYRLTAPPAAIMLLLAFLCAVAFSVFAADPALAYRSYQGSLRLIGNLLVLCVVCLTAASIPRYAKDIRKLLLFTCTGAALASFMAVLLILLWRFGLFTPGKEWIYRIGATPRAMFSGFADPNKMGNWLVALMPFAIVLAISQDSNVRTRMALWLWVALACVMLVLSYSRAAWLQLIVCMAAFLLLAKRLSLILAVTFLFSFGILGVWLIYGSGTLDQVWERGASAFSGRDPTVVWRLQRWKTEIAEFEKSPLIGMGIGKGFPKYAHNVYLRLLHETGVLGFMTFLLLHGWVVARLVQTRKNASSREGRLLASAGFASLAGMLVFHATTTSLGIIHIWFHLGMMIAITEVIRRNQ